MQTIIYTNEKIGNWAHYNRPEATVVAIGHQQVDTGQLDRRGRPLYENGPLQYQLSWDEAWGDPISEADLATWDEPETEPEPVQQNPVTDVEIAKRDAKKHYLERREIRQTNIDDLMVDVAFAMVAEGSFTADNVDEEGSEFIAAHGGHIYRYVMGGNKTAQDLYDAVVASKNAEAPARAFPWLSDAILAIFSKALLGR